METRKTTTLTYQQPDQFRFEHYERDNEISRQRLETILAVNAELAREKKMFVSEKERTEAEFMSSPISTEKTFAYLGLLLGTLPPAAFFLRFLLDTRGMRFDDLWILGVVAIVNLVSAIVGFFSGKYIGRIVREIESSSWTQMILLLPFIGILWGIMAGGAGGAVIFIVGAVFGAFVGATVGAFALPAFAIFHRLLKRGDKIERKHFLPLAFGVTFVVSAFILGL